MSPIRVLLLVIALLCLSDSAFSQEAYSGPDDAPTYLFTWSGAAVGACTPTAPYTAAEIAACLATAFPGYAITYEIGASVGHTSLPITTGTTSPANVTWRAILGGTNVASTAFSQTRLCNPLNRALGVLSGVQRCVSKCYSLRGASVSAFSPISDPAQSVPAACLFISGTGTCQIEAADTSNYTYGTQLYRGGTWVHVGQQCVEDASSPVSDGAINTSPTGGTGSGTTNLSEGTTATSKTEMLDAVATAQADAVAGLQDMKTYIETKAGAVTMEPVGGRWLPSLVTFLPAGVTPACEITAGKLIRTTAADVPLTISFCTWAPYAQDFLYWMFGLITMFGLWMMVFNPGKGEGA